MVKRLLQIILAGQGLLVKNAHNSSISPYIFNKFGIFIYIFEIGMKNDKRGKIKIIVTPGFESQ